MSQPTTGFLLFLCGGNTVPTWWNIPTRKTNQVPHQNYEGSRADHCHSQLSGPAHQRPSWGFQHKHVFSGPNRAPGGSLKVLQGLQGFHMQQQRTEDNSTGLSHLLWVLQAPHESQSVRALWAGWARSSPQGLAWSSRKGPGAESTGKAKAGAGVHRPTQHLVFKELPSGQEMPLRAPHNLPLPSLALPAPAGAAERGRRASVW